MDALRIENAEGEGGTARDAAQARSSERKIGSPTSLSRIEAANATLRREVHHLEVALDHMSQGLCMFDAQSRLVLCNQRYLTIFGLSSRTELVGMTQEAICALLISRGTYRPNVTIESIRDGVRLALRQDTGLPIIRELADGRAIAVLYRHIDGGGWVSTFEDITEQRRSEARIQHLAQHDGLTDLPNAHTLRDSCFDMLARLNVESATIAVAYLDLDRFKFVNDTYGHSVGDELLCAVAERIRHWTGKGAVAGRLGGDEFAVVFETDGDAGALRFAESLMASLSAPYTLSAGRVEVGVSVGVVTHRGRGGDVERLFQDADFALRDAKANGRGTVNLFDPAMAETARHRRLLEAELYEALAEEQFELHYQPLVEVRTQRTVGVEALVRWRHPEKGMVPPGSFIPMAEEIGLIVPLGQWVMRQACRDAATWPERILVAVNVSSLQMRQKSFADTVLAILEETGLPARRLEIEFTESALLNDCETTLENIATLRAAGISFAMDDFGTGYSSLSYLRRFPIDKIKIDRSFMKDAETSPDALAIIRAVASLGSSLGITTLVEGVETSRQLDVAKAEGVAQMQGYFFSRPQPESVIKTRLVAEMADGALMA